MKEPMLQLGSELSKVIGFTKDNFETGIIYNLLPRGIYITLLIPVCSEAVDQMFNLIDQKKMLFRYTAPQPEIAHKLDARGYYRAVDVAGTVFYCNFMATKNITSLEKPLTKEKIV